jgi:hypothetical protein
MNPGRRWFGPGWAPEGRRVEAQKIKVPIGRFCKKCGKQIAILDQGFILHNPWEKGGDVFHRACMPERATPEPAPASPSQPEVIYMRTTMVSNGVHKPAATADARPAEAAPPEVAPPQPAPPVSAPPPASQASAPVQAEERSSTAPPPPSSIPRRGDIMALVRLIERDALERMTPEEVAIEAKKVGLFVTRRQAYFARYHALHEKPEPEPDDDMPPTPSSKRTVRLDPKGPSARVYAFLKEHFQAHAAAPSGSLMCKRLKVDAPTLASALRTLRGRGLIAFESGNYSTIRLGGAKPAAPAAMVTKAKPASNGTSGVGLRAQLLQLIDQIDQETEREIETIRAKGKARKEALEAAMNAID